MPPRREELRPPVERHAGRAAATGERPPRRDAHRLSAHGVRGRQQPAEPWIPDRRPPPLADRGLLLLVVFTASALTIVALAVLVGAIERWWVLIPVMAVDFAVTAAVLVTVAKLLEDPDIR